MNPWKQRHDELAKMFTNYINEVNKLELLARRAEFHIEESDRMDLRERGVSRYVRLKEEVAVPTEYVNHTTDPKIYPAGTMLQARITGNVAHIYLDDNGDGNIYFPADKCEEVELSDEEAGELQQKGVKVIYQG